jgi:hypothetical protein
MSSAVVSTSAALGRPFIFDADADPEVGARAADPKKPAARQYPSRDSLIANVVQSTIKNQQSTIPLVTPASRLKVRATPEMASSGIPELDIMTGGLPRGCLTEICGVASSGRTTVLLAALAAATRRGEYCAVIDASDALDPQFLADSDVDLDRFLWVRCGEIPPQEHGGTEKGRNEKNGHGLTKNDSRQSEHRIEQVLRATDLLLESGGFGLIILDLADLPPQSARRIPLTTWFRFRRAVEHKSTILMAIEQHPIAGSCSSLLLQLSPQNSAEAHSANISRVINPAHTHLLTGLHIHAELICSRLDRKPAHSIAFATKTVWAG